MAALPAATALGITFPCSRPPSELIGFAVEAERAGYDELWIIEDCFWAGGVGAAAAALARTERIRVGIGILPAVMRNAATTAMEISGLAGLFPGRVDVGLGHGVGTWMQQIGAKPASPLTALREHLVAVRALLAGQEVTTHGRYVALDAVRLGHVPASVPPILTGVRGPKSLRLAGESADGTVLAEPAAPAYIREARRQIDAGRAGAERTDPYRLVAYNRISVADDDLAAIAAVRPVLAASIDPSQRAQLAPLGFGDELLDLAARTTDPAVLAAALPAEWVRELAIVGAPSTCAERIVETYAAGADSVVLVPLPGAEAETLQLARVLK
ncbi:MAG: LLM class flavin-dependent oxidoreductase [Mycobacteriales bacterium]